MGELSKLPNIGNTVEAQLNEVGITSIDDLKKIGAKEAWLKIQEIDESARINRLMALEGAIEGVKKIMLSDEMKADLIESILCPAFIPVDHISVCLRDGIPFQLDRCFSSGILEP